MAFETWYAAQYYAGNAVAGANAEGPANNTYAGSVNDGIDWTGSWRFDAGLNMQPFGGITGNTSTLYVYARKGSNTGDPTMTVTLMRGGVTVQVLATNYVVSNTSQVAHAFTVDQSLWQAAGTNGDMQIKIDVTSAGGSPGARNSIQVDAFRWEVDVNAIDEQFESNPPATMPGDGEWARASLGLDGSFGFGEQLNNSREGYLTWHRWRFENMGPNAEMRFWAKDEGNAVKHFLYNEEYVSQAFVQGRFQKVSVYADANGDLDLFLCARFGSTDGSVSEWVFDQFLVPTGTTIVNLPALATKPVDFDDSAFRAGVNKSQGWEYDVNSAIALQTTVSALKYMFLGSNYNTGNKNNFSWMDIGVKTDAGGPAYIHLYIPSFDNQIELFVDGVSLGTWNSARYHTRHFLGDLSPGYHVIRVEHTAAVSTEGYAAVTRIEVPQDATFEFAPVINYNDFDTYVLCSSTLTGDAVVGSAVTPVDVAASVSATSTTTAAPVIVKSASAAIAAALAMASPAVITLSDGQATILASTSLTADATVASPANITVAMTGASALTVEAAVTRNTGAAISAGSSTTATADSYAFLDTVSLITASASTTAQPSLIRPAQAILSLQSAVFAEPVLVTPAAAAAAATSAMTATAQVASVVNVSAGVTAAASMTGTAALAKVGEVSVQALTALIGSATVFKNLDPDYIVAKSVDVYPWATSYATIEAAMTGSGDLRAASQGEVLVKPK